MCSNGLDRSVFTPMNEMVWRIIMDKRIRMGYHEAWALPHADVRRIMAKLDHLDDIEWGVRKIYEERSNRR